MNKTEILKKLLPGFIPLFIFIIADEIWGTRTGLFVAIGSGIIEMIYVGRKEKRFDKFILFDTLLLVILGGVSIILNNDIFFKLKPGLIELILVAILGVSAFSSLNIVELMGQRYMKGVKFNDYQVAQMRKNLKALFYIFSVHTVLVFYSTFYMSKEAWAFISGGLFYILFGVYFVIEMFRQKRRQKHFRNEEWVPVVDMEGKVISQVPRSKVHNGSKLLHPVVHLHVLNKHSLLLQRRSKNKEIEPGKWDMTVGGHISSGENLEQALKKEAFEEIGLVKFTADFIKVYKWESELESELVYLFTTNDCDNYRLNSDELDELRFWNIEQIEDQLGKGVFTPNFEYEYFLLKENKII